MTKTAVNSRSSYVADGLATPRNIGFPLQSAADLIVKVNGTLQTLNTHYTITGPLSNPVMTPLSPFWANGATVRYRRKTPASQQYDAQAGAALSADGLEATLDRNVMAIQDIEGEQAELAARALQVPEGEIAGLLPKLADRIGKFFSWGPTGEVVPVLGTSGDPELRVSLASSVGARLVGFIHRFVGAIVRTVEEKLRDHVNVRDFGANGSIDSGNQTAALKAALLSGASLIYIPAGTYNIDLSQLEFLSNTTIFGDGPNTILQCPDAVALLADVSGNAILIDGKRNIKIRDMCIKNGYKGVGVKVVGSSNIKLVDLEVDGFTDGIWIGEDANLKGCKNVKIIRPTIKNQMYWGVYIRALGVTNPSDFTRFITLDGGYFYNCNMAGFVVAEGTPEHITLSNTDFERCPVAQHFELCRKYTVINCKDYDTKKYPDQLPCNLEYPFPTLNDAPQLGWSQYHFGSSHGTTSSCTFEQTINHYAGASSKCTDLKYTDTVALSWVYQGAGSIPDNDKNFFESHSWNNCTSNGVFIFQIESDPTNAYLRNFNIAQSECKIGAAGNSAGGSNVAVQIGRGIDFSFTNNSVRNGFLRVKSLGSVIVTGNKFLVGTDRTQTILDGINGASASLNFLNFSDNQIVNAGGVVIGDAAVLIQNWSVARADSFIYGSGNTNFVIRFKDCHRVEVGKALLANAIVANYVDTGVSQLVQL